MGEAARPLTELVTQELEVTVNPRGRYPVHVVPRAVDWEGGRLVWKKSPRAEYFRFTNFIAIEHKEYGIPFKLESLTADEIVCAFYPDAKAPKGTPFEYRIEAEFKGIYTSDKAPTALVPHDPGDDKPVIRN